MGEKKFRGKDLAGKWQYNYLTMFMIRKNTIGQYTGLKDKNGKEIYEGDIVEIKTIEGKIKGEVKYEDKFASYVFVNTQNIVHECENIGDYKKEDIEVIGNIFDNSELLEEN